MILTLPPIQLPATGEFERNPSFLFSFLYHRHRGPQYAIRTVLYPCTCTAHMYVCMYVAVGPLYIATFYKDRLFIAMYVP